MADKATILDTWQVQALLDRYYDGQTTPAEERRLRDFFAHAAVPAELQDERRFFLALDGAAESTAPPVDVERLMAQALSAQPDAKMESTVAAPRRFTVRRALWIAAIAACLALVFVLPSRIGNGSSTVVTTEGGLTLRDTYSDPNQAAVEAERALARFSESLDKGLAQLDKVDL
ncbi:MAG: hypothetical protein J6M53_00135 [Bacteroidaceae bacterium]|nr:hypothetical protein [Bacteroidaceae bacterium]